MKTIYLNILAILLLTGCASHVHHVVRENESPFIGGELAHEDGKDNRLVLEAPNRRYEARGFAVERQANLAELRKRFYATNPKHWERIFARLDTHHNVYFINTIAKTADGQEMSCQLMWKYSVKPSGFCTDQSGAVFPVNFE